MHVVIALDLYDMVGLLDDDWALVQSVLGRQRMLEMIASALSHPLYGDDEEELNESIRLELGYIGFDFERREDDYKRIQAFIWDKVRKLSFVIPNKGWLEIKEIHPSELSNMVYIVANHHVDID